MDGVYYQNSHLLPLHPLAGKRSLRLELDVDPVAAFQADWLLEREGLVCQLHMPGTLEHGQIDMVGPTQAVNFIAKHHQFGVLGYSEVCIDPRQPSRVSYVLKHEEFKRPASQAHFLNKLSVVGNEEEGFVATWTLIQKQPIRRDMGPEYVLVLWKNLKHHAAQAKRMMAAFLVTEHDSLAATAARPHLNHVNKILRELSSCLPGFTPRRFRVADLVSLDGLEEELKKLLPSSAHSLLGATEKISSKRFIGRVEISLRWERGNCGEGVIIPVKLITQTDLRWEKPHPRVRSFLKQNMGWIHSGILINTLGKEASHALGPDSLQKIAGLMHLEGLPRLVSALQLYNTSFLQLIQPWQKDFQAFAKSGRKMAVFMPREKGVSVKLEK